MNPTPAPTQQAQQGGYIPCAECGKLIAKSKRRRYCCQACKQKAYRKRRELATVTQ